MALPDGIEAIGSDETTVVVRARAWVPVTLLVCAALLLAFGVLMTVLAVVTPTDPGEEAIPVWIGVVFVVPALLLGWIAIRRFRRPQVIIDTAGFHLLGAFGGESLVRWGPMTRVELSQPRGNALWFTADGGIEQFGRLTARKRLQVAISGLRVRNTDLQRYVVERARSERRPG